jgi:hypothetical protein
MGAGLTQGKKALDSAILFSSTFIQHLANYQLFTPKKSVFSQS